MFRRRVGNRTLPPAEFLCSLTPEASADLFSAVLDQALSLRKDLGADGFDAYVTVNAEVSPLLSGTLRSLVRSAFSRHGDPGPGGLVVELLEGKAIPDTEALVAVPAEVRALGVALDDIGSGYSSLSNPRTLPVDVVKLDQCFARGLRDRPGDLHFVMSVQGLADALGKRLLVDGIESPEILDAVRVLGVDYGQGYGIARPMGADAVSGWLSSRPARHSGRTPKTLLGAYAAHLKVVKTSKLLMSQPLPIEWGRASRNPHACGIGRYLDACGTHDGAYGLAHNRSHEVMAMYTTDHVAWKAGADGFRFALEQALAEGRGHRFGCEATAS